jgi:putative oxidoreductase
MKKATFIEIIAALFILLFVYTAISKFLSFTNFKTVLHLSPLLWGISHIVAWVIPIAEILISLFLFIPKSRLIGLYSSFILMAAFTLYIGYMLAFEPNRPCTCGGIISKMSWPQHLIFNIVFTFLAWIGIRLHKKQSKQIVEEPPPVVFT